MSNSTTNSAAEHCDAARTLAASKLEAIVKAFAEEACGHKLSLAHAKFVLEIAQLAPAAATEKRLKSSAADTEADEAEDGESKKKSFSEFLVERLNAMRVDPVK